MCRVTSLGSVDIPTFCLASEALYTPTQAIIYIVHRLGLNICGIEGYIKSITVKNDQSLFKDW